MKRFVVLLALLAALALSAGAMAEDDGDLSAYVLASEPPLEIDLDGDGAAERVGWAMVPGEYSDAYLTLTVLPAQGDPLVYETGITYAEAVYVVDLDGDGMQEMLMSGDVMSDDYYTYCLHYADGALYEVLFPDCGRGNNADGYFRQGYGRIAAIGENRLVLEGTQDVLGTWMASRAVALTPYERFEFADDGVWLRSGMDALDDDAWAYAALTTTAALPYEGLDGAPAGTLAPGTKLMITASDKEAFARFITPDGVAGALALAPDYEKGWGRLVDGRPEDECFERIPYAD